MKTTPTQTLYFRNYFGAIPSTAKHIELRLYSPGGEDIGLLDRLEI